METMAAPGTNKAYRTPHRPQNRSMAKASRGRAQARGIRIQDQDAGSGSAKWA
jgi:hypothetical protein